MKLNYAAAANVSSGSNLSAFAREIKAFRKDLEKELKFVLKKSSEFAFAVLVQNSPYPAAMEFKVAPSNSTEPRKSPYSTGAYLLSHKVGINGPSSDPPIEKIVTYKTGLNKEKTKSIDLKADKARVMSEFLAKDNANMVIAQIKAFDSVHFTNKNSHALNVEYGDWNWKGATAPAYHTYGHAWQYINANMIAMIQPWAEMAHN